MKYKWNKRILIVDDELEIANGYKDILCPKEELLIPTSRHSVQSAPKKNENFEVDIANSFEKAMELIEKSIQNQRPYTMGFFDVLLGESQDGIDLVKSIFQLDPDIYAVFVTAYHDRSVESIRTYLNVKSLERWDYLNKPLNDGELIQKARNFNALWNLKKEKQYKDHETNALRQQIFEAEKSTSIAAISRSITHEFGNILMQIMGKADISRKKGEEDMRSALNSILEASIRASKIIEKYKHTGSFSGAHEKTQARVKEIVDRAIDLMEGQIATSKTKVDVQVISDELTLLNSTALLQVFINLLINSIHAMGSGGSVKILIESDDQNSTIFVHDNGPGIPEEIRDQVLQPFFTTKGAKGSGLGLAICKEIIEIEHGGEFQLFHENGLKIKMTIPREGLGQESNEKTSDNEGAA